MEPVQSPKKGRAPPRVRKSIAYLPSPDVNIEKENLTTDPTAETNSTLQAKAAAKKPRSKSIGPGGLDALREDAGNRRQSAAMPLIKSILKPTIPLSPPKQIPPHHGARRTSPNKTKSKTTPEKLQRISLLDASVLESSNPTNSSSVSPSFFEGSTTSSAAQSSVSSPSQRRTRVAVRTEEEQQAAAKDRERQEALDHKNARRKSLANRRVSFAPEATLHVWDVIEFPEDSTTSSASPNSTRRASTLSKIAASPYAQPRSQIASSDPSEPPSTPPKPAEEVQVAASPAHQRDLHRKKRRRSSVIPPMNFNNLDDFSSSPISGDSVNDDDDDDDDDTANQAIMKIDEDEESSNSDDHDLVVDESTVTEVDADDVTTHSNDASSTGSSGKLEEALRQAAEQAGTKGIDFDENADISMEMADDEITASFKPWITNGKYVPQTIGNLSVLQDENTNPFSPAFKAKTLGQSSSEDVEKTMEFTQAVGSILTRPEKSPKSGRRKSSIVGKRRSSGASMQSSGDGSVVDDETMDLTTAIGSIQANAQLTEIPRDNLDHGSDDEAEELTMEFTSVVGGLIGKSKGVKGINEALAEGRDENRPFLEGGSRESEESSYNEEDMEMTAAAGGILKPITKYRESIEDQTVDMDITTAIGTILQERGASNKSEVKISMQRESDKGLLSGSELRSSAASPRISNHVATMASETGSPSLTTSQRRVTAKKPLFPKQSTTPKLESRQSTPLKKPTTPSKHLTPKLKLPTTPGKTPPSRNSATKMGSPKKLFKAEIKQGELIPPSLTSNLLFNQNESTGSLAPSVILKPRSRRSSGLGIDREGLGSPRVTALLDRRRSIGDDAKVFVSQDQIFKGVTFEDPKAMGEELENQRAEDERRESGRGILQMESDSQDLEEERDVTSNLKDMIESLTPKKKKLNGRKSLHVGAAKGLLGKRPAELDEDEEDEDSTPKRLKGREGSPVKKVRLPAHPSKIGTTSRVTRSSRPSLTEISENNDIGTPTQGVSPAKKTCITTPKSQPRFRDAELHLSAAKGPASFGIKLNTETAQAVNFPEEEDRIHLQDFLNMTSIRFMELTTTKRRLTVAPNSLLENGTESNFEISKTSVNEKNSGLESCVVAGACTIPMLELYQHSCRELKKYIAEGRSIVREIEVDTFEENPPLFREYMLAPPDIKPIMDYQFKNVKTHARLLSKAMWYEWRMKLLDGLKEGLVKVSDGMNEDDTIIRQQEGMIEPILPALIQEHEQLEAERQTLQSQVDELASYDQEELQDARNNLIAIEDEVHTKRKVLEELQSEIRRNEDGIEYAIERKQQHLEEIREAEKTCQDCRGWSNLEVNALQASVDKLEKANSWNIISANGSSLTMSYKRTLELFFSPASFLQNTANASQSAERENSPISLSYVADTHENHPQPLVTEKRFFLQIMRAQLQCLPQNQTKIKNLLSFISSNWEQACTIADESRMLGISYITESMILSDEVMKVRSILLLRDMRTKVELGFEVSVNDDDENVLESRIAVRPSARVVYGEELKEKKMVEFLDQRIVVKNGQGKGHSDSGVWARAVGGLEEKLIARGRK